jgi:hypothetical protein
LIVKKIKGQYVYAVIDDVDHHRMEAQNLKTGQFSIVQVAYFGLSNIGNRTSATKAAR